MTDVGNAFRIALFTLTLAEAAVALARLRHPGARREAAWLALLLASFGARLASPRGAGGRRRRGGRPGRLGQPPPRDPRPAWRPRVERGGGRVPRPGARSGCDPARGTGPRGPPGRRRLRPAGPLPDRPRGAPVAEPASRWTSCSSFRAPRGPQPAPRSSRSAGEAVSRTGCSRRSSSASAPCWWNRGTSPPHQPGVRGPTGRAPAAEPRGLRAPARLRARAGAPGPPRRGGRARPRRRPRIPERARFPACGRGARARARGPCREGPEPPPGARARRGGRGVGHRAPRAAGKGGAGGAAERPGAGAARAPRPHPPAHHAGRRRPPRRRVQRGAGGARPARGDCPGDPQPRPQRDRRLRAPGAVGGRTPRAARGARGGPGGALVEVHDNAGGVPAAQVPRLFQPGGSTRGSTGVGLYLARCLAERNGGTLPYRPADGGSRFTLELPRSHPAPARRRRAAGGTRSPAVA